MKEASNFEDVTRLWLWSQKSRNKFPAFSILLSVEITFLDPAVRSEPLNQNGGHSTVLPRADGPRAGGLGKQELVLQGMCCSSTGVRGLLQDNAHHANCAEILFF